MNDQLSFARGLNVRVQMSVTVNDELVADTDVRLTPELDGNYTVDNAVEWLGQIERGALKTDIDILFDEHMEAING